MRGNNYDIALDDIDVKILSILQRDARTSINSISRQINLSGPAVIRRIHRMEDNGVIHAYRAIVNPDKLGLKIHGYIVASVQSMHLSRFYDYIAGIREITRCETIIAGGKEVILEFHCRDSEHLMVFYDKLPITFVDSMTAYLTKGNADKYDIIEPLPAEENE